MFDKMKQLMEMKKQAERIKRELDSETVNVDAGGIKVKINGSQNFQSIEVEESLLSQDSKIKLEDKLLSACNQAIAQSQALAAQKMKSVMPGFPGA